MATVDLGEAEPQLAARLALGKGQRALEAPSQDHYPTLSPAGATPHPCPASGARILPRLAPSKARSHRRIDKVIPQRRDVGITPVPGQHRQQHRAQNVRFFGAFGLV
jgi:hypothetical protein